MICTASNDFMTIKYEIWGETRRRMASIVDHELNLGNTCVPKTLVTLDIRPDTRINTTVQSFDRIGLTMVTRVGPMLDLVAIEKGFEVLTKEAASVIANKNLRHGVLVEPLFPENFDYELRGDFLDWNQPRPLRKDVHQNQEMYITSFTTRQTLDKVNGEDLERLRRQALVTHFWMLGYVARVDGDINENIESIFIIPLLLHHFQKAGPELSNGTGRD